MRTISYTIWLAEQASGALLYYWGITLFLAAGLVVSLIIQAPLARGNRRLGHLAIFVPSVITILILSFGALMAHPTDSPQFAPTWPKYVVLALLVCQFLACIAVVVTMNGYRIFAAFLVGVQLWYGLACAFVAGMSVSGDWL